MVDKWREKWNHIDFIAIGKVINRRDVLCIPQTLGYTCIIKLYYLDLYLECVTFSEVLLLVRSHREHRITFPLENTRLNKQYRFRKKTKPAHVEPADISSQAAMLCISSHLCVPPCSTGGLKKPFILGNWQTLQMRTSYFSETQLTRTTAAAGILFYVWPCEKQ